MQWPSADKPYPKLSPKLATQLESIPLTDNLYRPCMVSLADGSKVDRVYVCQASKWIESWGVWPEDDDAKWSLDVEQVVCVEPSPSALPTWCSVLLYEAGESGMGYTLYLLQFSDGSDAAYYTGNAVDFTEYPAGQSAETVAAVIPHAGRDRSDSRSAGDYLWCLYGT